MLFLKKIISSFFIFISLILLSFRPAFAAKTFTYYASTSLNPAQCETQAEPICAAAFSKQFVSTQNVTYAYQGCSPLPSNANQYEMKITSTPHSFVAYTNSWVDGTVTNRTAIAAAKISKSCADTEVLKMDGCNVTCEVDPCKAVEGHKFTQIVECGSVSCPNSGTFQGNIGGMACSSGKPIFTGIPRSTAIQDTCTGSSPILSSSQGMIRVAAVGLTSTTSYCAASYTYTGSSANTQQVTNPNDLASLAFIDGLPTSEDGSCPDAYPKKGQVNGAWVCLPAGDLGDNPCPTGQITNNNGVCVPLDEAGTCPDGQTRDASGQCSATPPDSGNGDSCGQFQVKVNGVCVDSSSDGGGGGGGGGGGSSGSGDGSDSGSGDDSTPSSTNGDAKPEASSTGANSGACKDQPVCNGDPLMCASIQQTWRSGCELTKAMLDVSQSQIDGSNATIKASQDNFNAIKASKEASATGFFDQFKTKATSSSSFNCISDVSLPVMGKSLVIRFSQACDFFRFLRVLVIFSAYLAAARIVFRGIS